VEVLEADDLVLLQQALLQSDLLFIAVTIVLSIVKATMTGPIVLVTLTVSTIVTNIVQR